MTPLKITAGMVAAELRRLADALDTTPDTTVHHVYLSFSSYTKEAFTALAKVFPKPMAKEVLFAETDYSELQLRSKDSLLNVRLTVPQSLTCTLVEPAKPAVYKCDPIFSPDEEAQLEGAA